MKSWVTSVQQFLRSHANLHRQGEKPNILIFSLPRSGSTWLQELIWTQPGFKYCNEPLNLKGPFLREKSKISGFDELYSEQVEQKLIDYFKGFTSGKFHFLDPNPLRKNYRLFTNRIVFKVIHGGEFYINNIASAINGRVVYLLRHPIPVSLSRRQLPRMEQLCSDWVLDHFPDKIKVYAKELNAKGDGMQRRILAWCIQNKLALLKRNDSWLVLTYEQLVCEPNVVIGKLAEHLDLPKKDRMIDQVYVPSAVSVQSEASSLELMKDTDDLRTSLVSKWKTKVDESMMKDYLAICANMEMTVYDDKSGYPKEAWVIK